MIGVDIKSLLEKCNDFSSGMLHAAAGQAVNRTHYEVAIEHFMLACIGDARGDMALILEQYDVETGKAANALNAALEGFATGNAARPTFSPLLLELLENAWLIASVDLKQDRLRSGAALLAFLRKPGIYSQGGYTELFTRINREEVMRSFAALTAASTENAASPTPGRQPAASGQSGASFIAGFCEDFTAKAAAGKVDPVFGRDAEIRMMVDILARRRKNNPILVGEPGVGKTAVLEGLALRIVREDVPEVLRGVSLLALDLGLLEAGAGMKGEYERRLKGVLDEVKASAKPIVLFIDEAHTMVGAGGGAGGLDAANLMKPALARGELRACAATTWKEYKKYFEKDAALARRFQLVPLDEPSAQTTAMILRGIKASYEQAHGVLVRDDALAAAANLAHRYISGRFLPDKAVDLLDTACARAKVSMSAKPAALEDKERAAQAAQRELDGLRRDMRGGLEADAGRAAGLEALLDDLQAQASDLELAWREEKNAAQNYINCREAMLAEAGDNSAAAAFEQAGARLKALRGQEEGLVHVEVTPALVARVVSDWTGIPVGRMAEEQAETVRELDTLLKRRIKGQDQALAEIARAIQAGRAGLRAPGQPAGVFLLVGPSGVGKTETGLALADLLFGDERNAVTVNMSEFQEKHTVSRLIGSPPGYVGFGEGGMLTEAVRRRPYSVVLLDEVEKAHIDVLNLFHQVFDKGVLSDGEGREISFANTVIMLTSNLAAEKIAALSLTTPDPGQEALVAAVRPALSAHFRPALLARMSIVPYRALAEDALLEITELKLNALARRLRENNGMLMTRTPEVARSIAARCSETETGARNIEHILSGAVLPRLAQSILAHMAKAAMPAAVALDIGDDGNVDMTFS